METGRQPQPDAALKATPMQPPTITTRWRDTPLTPDSYDDLPSLVVMARRARMKPVDIEWYFSDDDLRRLQRVVNERGRSYTGRYRAFDARERIKST
jgi:hypothetical protein